MAALKLVSISDLDDHPDNPRLVIRDDVVAAIAANLDGEYPQKHAIHVRPIGDRYQILAGHHRKRAAEKAGLSEIWAWVEELDDAEAFMALATSNAQGELSPLEIGMHALKAVENRRGKKGGGFQDYAKRIGKTPAYVTQLHQAAEVLTSLNELTQVKSFIEKAKHLCAIHKLPKSCWQSACEWLATHAATVEDVEARVSRALTFKTDHGITKDWQTYLPPLEVCGLIFCGADAGKFQRLLALAIQVNAWLLSQEVDLEDLRADWVLWLEKNAGSDSYEQQKVQEKRLEIEAAAFDRMEAGEVGEAVEVLLADPPWQYDFSPTDSRQIENQYPTGTTEEIALHISDKQLLPHPLADNCVLFLWATAPKLLEAIEVMGEWGFTYKTHAVWDKEKIGMGYWFRGQHELLLVGTRGEASPPDESSRFASVFRETREGHSRKPTCIYEALKQMFPNARRWEMYQREPREGWPGGGNEA